MCICICIIFIYIYTNHKFKIDFLIYDSEIWFPFFILKFEFGYWQIDFNVVYSIQKLKIEIWFWKGDLKFEFWNQTYLQCPLFEFRFGKNTYNKRTLTDEQRQELAERMKKARESKKDIWKINQILRDSLSANNLYSLNYRMKLKRFS